MATNSKIEWTKRTWNPILGCSIISPGCHNCYAMTMARRLKAMALADLAAGKEPGRKRHYIDVIGPDGRWNGKLVLVPEALPDPLGWKTPQTIFVNSMSDLFHENMARRGHPEGVRGDGEGRLARLPGFDQASRPAAGAAVRRCGNSPSCRTSGGARAWRTGARAAAYRTPAADTRGCAVPVRRAPPGGSRTPGPVGHPLGHRGRRERHAGAADGGRLARAIRDQCVQAGVSFFFKQWSGRNVKAAGRELDGVTWDEMPGTPGELVSLTIRTAE